VTADQESELYKMVNAIYHHLGLDGQRPLSINHVQQEAQKNVLKWKSKKLMKEHERERT
jgi:hypothetical protein